MANIAGFRSELARDARLRSILSRVHAWYAARNAQGGWDFGPSKYVGYRSNDTDQYLRSYNLPGGAHGAKSERVLEQWFAPVDPHSRLGSELDAALREFLAQWDRVPRRAIRINVLRSELDAQPPRTLGSTKAGHDPLARISVDPAICGGRPCIKGTRMRVSDLVEAMAQGATASELLEDFPYLVEEDIAAALAFAARASDHRVIWAA